MLKHLLPAALLITAACAQAQPASRPEKPEARAERILGKTPLADGHNDWPMALRAAYGLEGAKTADLNQPAGANGHTSIPLIRKGKLGIQLWSVYVSASLPPEQAVQQTFEQIDVAKSFAQRYPEQFATVTTAAEAEKAWKSGRVAGFIALEGANQIADDIPTLRRAYAAGVRSMTLAHSKSTRLFDSATDTPIHKGGMAREGAAMIAEMNRLGMLVDLSHVSAATMHAVLDVTKSPVIFSHSGAKAVTDHPRNVPDDVLKRLPKNGGIVMANFYPAFIDRNRVDWEARRTAAAAAAGPDATAVAAARKAFEAANPRPVSTLAMVADHIEHIAKVAGHDHVGIGGDFDGIPDTPQGLENVGAYPALFAELARRGWSDADLRKLAGENFLRVLKANERIAAAAR